MSTNVAVLCMAVPWLAGTVWYGPSVLLWETLSDRQAVPDGKCFVDFFDNVGYLIVRIRPETILDRSSTGPVPTNVAIVAVFQSLWHMRKIVDKESIITVIVVIISSF